MARKRTDKGIKRSLAEDSEQSVVKERRKHSVEGSKANWRPGALVLVRGWPSGNLLGIIEILQKKQAPGKVAHLFSPRRKCVGYGEATAC